MMWELQVQIETHPMRLACGISVCRMMRVPSILRRKVRERGKPCRGELGRRLARITELHQLPTHTAQTALSSLKKLR